MLNLKKVILGLGLLGVVSSANADCNFKIQLYYFDASENGSGFTLGPTKATVSLKEGQSYRHPNTENVAANYIYCLKNSYLKYTDHNHDWRNLVYETKYSAPIIISKSRVPTQTQIAYQEATGIAPVYDVDRPNSYFSRNEDGGYEKGNSLLYGPAFQISNRTDRLYLEDLEAKNPTPGSQEVIDLKSDNTILKTKVKALEDKVYSCVQ